MTVTWLSIYENSGAMVLYDTIPRGGEIGLYRYFTEGGTHTYLGASGFIHDVELSGLMPEMTYYLICGGDGGWSRELAFRTAPLGRRDLRFVVGGDSRTNLNDRDLISRAMSVFNPRFVLFSGDMVADGNIQSQWDDFFGHMDEYWMGDNGLAIPVIPALGNHEKNSDKYFDQFALPGNEEWYSIDWGSDLHITVLNSETGLEGIEAQTEWLEEDLSEHSDYPWKVVLFHRNVLKSYHDWFLAAINHWVPIFDRYGVDLVVTGHSHNYMRSKPVNLTASHEEAMPTYAEGVMYLSSGGWGAPLYETVQGWWVAHTESTLHFALIDIYLNGTMHVQAKSGDGETFDEVRIHKELPNLEELLSTRLEKTEAKLLALEDENEILLSEITILRGEIDELISQNQTETEREKGLESQLSDFQDQLEMSEEGYAELLEEKVELENVVVARTSQLEEVENKVEKLDRVIQQRTYILGVGLSITLIVLAVLGSRLRLS
jgi:hypothetical protein